MLIRDNGMHFIEKKFEVLLKKYGVHHKYGLGYYPQTKGQVEISNRKIKSILEKTVVRFRKDWADKLDDLFGLTRPHSRLQLGLLHSDWFMVSRTISPWN